MHRAALLCSFRVGSDLGIIKGVHFMGGFLKHFRGFFKTLVSGAFLVGGLEAFIRPELVIWFVMGLFLEMVYRPKFFLNKHLCRVK